MAACGARGLRTFLLRTVGRAERKGVGTVASGIFRHDRRSLYCAGPIAASAGLSFRQIGPPGAPSWRPTTRMGTLRDGVAMPASLFGPRRPPVGVNAFSNALRCLCHAGLGREAGATVSNGLEPSAKPSSESNIQRARAIPASNRRFAKANRLAGTQRRIGLNVPERY
jgi:hypothetical protein